MTASGPACANCATPLAGRYCHACGQDSRPDGFGGALLAGLAELASLDLRLPRSLLILAWPGELARRYAEGRRAPYVPPLRLALASSLVLLVAWALRLPDAGAPTVTTGLGEDLAYMADSASFALVLAQLAVLPLLALATAAAAPNRPGGLKRHVTFVLYFHAAANGLAIALIALSFFVDTSVMSWIALSAGAVLLGPYLIAALKRFYDCGWLRLGLLWPLVMGVYLLLTVLAFMIAVAAAGMLA
ncbi:MAG: DUF3667 domain-containing protein [Oceanicaulis sp.]